MLKGFREFDEKPFVKDTEKTTLSNILIVDDDDSDKKLTNFENSVVRLWKSKHYVEYFELHFRALCRIFWVTLPGTM